MKQLKFVLYFYAVVILCFGVTSYLAFVHFGLHVWFLYIAGFVQGMIFMELMNIFEKSMKRKKGIF
jgi:hypothetical protein